MGDGVVEAIHRTQAGSTAQQVKMRNTGAHVAVIGVRGEAGEQREPNDVACENHHAVVQINGYHADARSHEREHEFGGDNQQRAADQAVINQGTSQAENRASV